MNRRGVWIFEMDALNAANDPVTLRFADGEYDDGLHKYRLLMKQPALLARGARGLSVLPSAREEAGAVVLLNNTGQCNFLVDDDYAIDGRTARVLFAENGVVTEMIQGTVRGNPIFAGETVTIRYRDPQEGLNQPHPLATYSGSSYYGAVMDDMPVGYWRLGDANATALDASGYDRHGAYQGGYTLGRDPLIANDKDKAALLDGVSGHVTAPSISPASVFSLETVFVADTLPSGCALIAEDGPSTVQFALGFCNGTLGSVTGGRPFVGFYSAGVWHGVAGPSDIAVGIKQHLAATYDGTNFRLYLNGTQIATAAPGGTYVPSAGTIFLGKRWDAASSTPYFDGTLDECAIYDVALSAGRIAQHAGFVG